MRYKPHTLSRGEEKLLAMQSEMADAADKIFRQLTDADLKFGMIRDDKGNEVELSHASFSLFLHSPDRNVRRKAFHQYYEQFKGHENTLAATLSARCSATSTTRRPATIRARSRPRCFPTTCR